MTPSAAAVRSAPSSATTASTTTATASSTATTRHARPLANGGAEGAGDPKFRGKPVLRCQKAIRAAGSTLRQADCAPGCRSAPTASSSVCSRSPATPRVSPRRRRAARSKPPCCRAARRNLETRLGREDHQGAAARRSRVCCRSSPAPISATPRVSASRATSPPARRRSRRFCSPSVTSAIADEHRCRTLQTLRRRRAARHRAADGGRRRSHDAPLPDRGRAGRQPRARQADRRR